MKILNKEDVIVRVITPPVASTSIDLDLVNLTEYLTKKVFKGKWQGGGLLGGEFGYGCDYENDVFMMHQYCWCDQDNCKWCNGKEPNFRHKKSGLEIKWYKWIGRGMKFNKKVSPKKWKEIYQDCVKSINREGVKKI
jgi:hypothetical protein